LLRLLILLPPLFIPLPPLFMLSLSPPHSLARVHWCIAASQRRSLLARAGVRTHPHPQARMHACGRAPSGARARREHQLGCMQRTTCAPRAPKQTPTAPRGADVAQPPPACR
jgi:hypothetical protein